MKKINNKTIIMIAVFVGLYAFPAFCSTPELENITHAINNSDARWEAGDNWLMRLSPEERKSVTGAVLPEASMEISSRQRQENRGQTPAQFDWRNVEGYDWMTEVKNQGGCGSCAAFASLGALEAIVRVVQGNPELDIDLSEQHLFSCAEGDCPTGLYMGAAFNYIQTNGVPDEDCLPYTAVDDNCADTCSDWEARAVKIDDWELLWQFNSDDALLKEYVHESPVACYLEVYSDFMSYDSGIYEYVTGNLLGGHFVVIVGWNDDDNYWICKNSWGKNWGENGYFRIKKGEVNIGTWAMVPTYTVPPATPTPAVIPTATPVLELGVSLEMPRTTYCAGDIFYLNAVVSNPGALMEDIPLFVFLDIEGSYWFWPGWLAYPPAIDWRPIEIPQGTVKIIIFDPFEWPELSGSADNLCFWAVLLNQDYTDIIGTYDQFSWGY